MARRNFEKLRMQRSATRYGTETVNGDQEAALLLRMVARPHQPKVPKAKVRADGDVAVAEFLANGGKIKNIPAPR